MNVMKWLGAAAVALGTSLGAATASADGLVAVPSDLPAKQRAELKAAIDQYKIDNPAAFERLRKVEGHKPHVYKNARKPTPIIVERELRRLGSEGLLPMLEALAFDVWPRDGASDEEWRALTRGMLAAVGHLHDPRASSVLQVAFAKASHPDLQLSAASALGQVCSDGDLDVLEDATAGPKRTAALAGLGECRRLEAAQVLANALDQTSKAAEASRIGKALGTLSSSWAWKAKGAKYEKESLEVRRVASAALVRGFVRFTGKAERSMRFGLTMAAHPQIRSIAKAHRQGAGDAKVRKLNSLVTVIERRAKR